MRKFALAAVLALTSSAAYAGSFEIPINGRVARIRIDDKCRESVCASVSLSERGSRGQRREFKLPGISSKTLSNMLAPAVAAGRQVETAGTVGLRPGFRFLR